MNKSVYFQDLGVVDFKKTWDYQEKLLNRVVAIKFQNRKSSTKQPTPNYFLFVEHPHVYTLGKSGNKDHLLMDEKQLQNKGVTLYRTNRGGDITYHGPGQIVCYMILDLENFFTDIHRYLRCLEDVIITTLEDYNVKGERSKGETGVWIDTNSPFSRKICAMGIRVSRWVTMHGFALNVNTDLKHFEHIIPCGIRNKSVTSLKKELHEYHIPIQEVKSKIVENFKSVLEVDFIEMS